METRGRGTLVDIFLAGVARVATGARALEVVRLDRGVEVRMVFSRSSIVNKLHALALALQTPSRARVGEREVVDLDMIGTHSQLSGNLLLQGCQQCFTLCVCTHLGGRDLAISQRLSVAKGAQVLFVHIEMNLGAKRVPGCRIDTGRAIIARSRLAFVDVLFAVAPDEAGRAQAPVLASGNPRAVELELRV